MYSRDAVQAINADQIATPTDRMLLGGMPRHRPHPRVPQYDAVPERTVVVRKRSQRHAVVGARAAIYVSFAIIVVCLLV